MIFTQSAGRWGVHPVKGNVDDSAWPNKSQQQGPAQLNLIFVNISAYCRPLVKVYVVEQEALILSSLWASSSLPPPCECYCMCFFLTEAEYLVIVGIEDWQPSGGLRIRNFA